MFPELKNIVIQTRFEVRKGDEFIRDITIKGIHSCSASPVPIHLVGRVPSCCQSGLFINNPLCSALTGTAWQSAGVVNEQCHH